jgi:formate-dependent nitrite reductase membrane component NrfD
MGLMSWNSDLFTWVAPILGSLFLAITGVLLIWDLSHPTRFYMIFTKPHWGSWLVRGAFLIAGFGLVLAVQLLSGLIGSVALRKAIAFPGLPLAVMASVYTAYLFAQSKARDLWQSPLLPAHMGVQTLLAGSAAVLLIAEWLDEAASVEPLGRLLGASALTHLLFVLGEVTVGHVTAHSHLAVWEMVRGRYASFFWIGVALVAVGLSAPWIGAWAAPFALIGLLSHEHAYVQAAQAVPLA